MLSLSPGPTALENAAVVGEYAQMWRISDDHWDGWTFEHKPGEGEYPFGVRDAFDRLAKWLPYVRPGNWPDADMLPWGWLGPHPGMGEARQSRETQDEQRTEFTLWAIARSPLILGANLTRLDDFTRSLITNQTMLFMNQNVTYSHPVDTAGLAPALSTPGYGGEPSTSRGRGFTGVLCLFQPRRQAGYAAHYVEAARP